MKKHVYNVKPLRLPGFIFLFRFLGGLTPFKELEERDQVVLVEEDGKIVLMKGSMEVSV